MPKDAISWPFAGTYCYVEAWYMTLPCWQLHLYRERNKDFQHIHQYLHHIILQSILLYIHKVLHTRRLHSRWPHRFLLNSNTTWCQMLNCTNDKPYVYIIVYQIKQRKHTFILTVANSNLR